MLIAKSKHQTSIVQVRTGNLKTADYIVKSARENKNFKIQFLFTKQTSDVEKYLIVMYSPFQQRFGFPATDHCLLELTSVSESVRLPYHPV